MAYSRQVSFVITSGLMLLVIALPLFFYLMVDQETINHFIQTHQPNNTFEYLVLFAMLALVMSIGLPRQIAAFSSGYLLGTFYGALFATLAASLACVITFTFSRFVFHQQLQKRYPEKIAALNAFFSSRVFIKALAIRLIPAGSNFLTNVLAGTAKAKVFPYLAGTMVGFLPQMTLFSMLGAGVNVGSKQQVIISVITIVIAGLLITYLYKSKRSAGTKKALVK